MRAAGRTLTIGEFLAEIGIAGGRREIPYDGAVTVRGPRGPLWTVSSAELHAGGVELHVDEQRRGAASGIFSVPTQSADPEVA